MLAASVESATNDEEANDEKRTTNPTEEPNRFLKPFAKVNPFKDMRSGSVAAGEVNEGFAQPFLTEKLAQQPHHSNSYNLTRTVTDVGDDIDYRTEAHQNAMEDQRFRPRQRMNSALSSDSDDVSLD